MPLPRLIEQDQVRLPPQDDEEVNPIVKRPRLEPTEENQERPYRDLVENETRRYWQEIEKQRNLVKPTQYKIRAAAMPILCQALRRRTDSKKYLDPDLAQRSVAAMALHALEQGWIEPPFSEPHNKRSYVEALILMADKANWLAREIPLPDHPPPHHPSIFYTIDPATNHPVPREDSLILGDYVYLSNASRITESSHILPWVNTDILPYSKLFYPESDEEYDAYYILEATPGNNPGIVFHWLQQMDGFRMSMVYSISGIHFSPQPPAIADPGHK